MKEAEKLIGLIQKNNVNIVKNKTDIKHLTLHIQKLSDNEISVTELMKSVFEKLSELVDHLNKRKIDYLKEYVGKIRKKVKQLFKQKGGEKHE